MASKICTPANLYGPYEQTLFLGCSVLGFTASAGWGGQASEVTIELVEDTCDAKAGYFKRIWTSGGGTILSSPLQHTGPAPGFTNPNIGAPAYFRVQDFEFTGLIQSFTKKSSTSSIAYSVKLVDPRPILDHAQVILDTYQGGHQGLYNVFNVYGYLEYINSTVGPDGNFCGDNLLQHEGAGGGGTAVGAPAQGFGGARRSERGISWTLIKQALKDLAGGPYGSNSPAFSLGALFYRQGTNNGYGELSFPNFSSPAAGARYVLDISELPDPYSWDYRIAGPVVSLSDLINQVCSDAGADYYVELLPSSNSLVIKVRTVLRTQALGSSTTISNFIASKDVDAGGNGVISNSIGRELRSDVNSTLLIGGKARQYFQQTNTSYITPFWGFDIDGNLQQGRYLKTECGGTCIANCWRVLLDFRKINLSLGHPVVLDIETNSFGEDGFGWVLEVELRMAMGDYETFKNKIINDTHKNCETGADTVLKRYFKETLFVQSSKTNDQKPTSERGATQSAVPGSRATEAESEGIQDGLIGQKTERDKQTLYNWLHAYAQTYYGTKFLTLVPGICLVESTVTDPTLPITSPANITTIYSDEPSTDGGWASLTDRVTTLVDSMDILGLTNYTARSDTFKDTVGKLSPILKFRSSGDLDVSDLAVADYVTDGTDGSGVWLKGSIDSEWVAGSPIYGDSHYNSAADGGGRKLSALITASARMGLGDPKAVAKTNQNSTPDSPADGAVDRFLTDAEVSGISKENGGHAATAGSVGSAFVHPIAIGVPLKSNTRTYGPWYVAGANPGSVTCEIDDGLVPWEYGGISFMNTAGIAKVQNSATAMQFGDRGEVTIPGYPNLSVGSPLSSTASLLFGARSLNVGVKQWPRGPASYGEVNWAAPAIPAGGGASVTNINVSVGTQGVTTSYSISTFTPVFGRFSKGNADRIKQIGLNKLAGERERRADSAVKRAIQMSEDRRIANTPIIGKDPIAPKSPAIWFVGKLTEDGRRKIVISADALDLAYNTDYDNNAIMTIDGFFRPVSLTGGVEQSLIDAGDGKFIPRINQQNPTGDIGQYAERGFNQTPAPPPPVNEYSGLPIRQKYLDFLGDPYHNTGLFDDYRTKLVDGATLVPAFEGNDGLNPYGGHDVEGVARKSLAYLTGQSPTSNNTLLFHDGTSLPTGGSGYANDYRFLAHRGPLVIHGWGYDIYGKPIPNASGDEGSSTGNFNTSYVGLSDRFKENWLGDARDWPVAPVDLRFDRKRGVWTVPPAFRLYQVQSVNGAVAGGSGTFEIIKSKDDLSDASGNLIESPTILAENWSSVSITKTEKNVAYYDSPSSSYWLLGGGGGQVVAGVSASGTPAVYDSTYKTLEDGCIHVWAFVKPNDFNTGLVYEPNDRASISIGIFDNETTYTAGAQVRFTGDGPLCQYHSYVAPTGQIPGVFDTGAWTRSGCETSIQYINSGVTDIGPGDFGIESGWLRATGETYLDTGCTVTWDHGMFTTPVQGHYVEGGAGNDILVWYDCEVMRGWSDIA